ncbi:ImmA/IrrE family metallo-endopeptidase [Amycolatopsis sp. MJM2582]|uniref:helix-turn-helix domain-containing protein n=1 Tax=Amycolatopsis sp. MJM2582 TaxID=1427749 RepID=UPI0009DE8C48|nr:XRE family transcriptional regulator [Amycolatopsis sp. MJM2582]
MSDTRAAGRMVALTREAKAWTQARLAKAAGVSQGFLSKVEHGVLPLEGERLAHVAMALEAPPELLSSSEPVRGLEVTCLHHRRRASRMTVGTTRRIEGLTHLTRLSVEGLSTGLSVAPDLTLHHLDVDEHGSPEAIARLLRIAWRVPTGPVADVTKLLETLGVAIVRRDLHTEAQDAVSTWPPGHAPVVLINRGLSADRERFTLVHELGHLVMHTLPNDDQEGQANRFAGEFLAPADEVRPQLEGLTVRQFSKLAELKQIWGMSMAALIRRALDLECISANQFKSFRIRLNQYGWSEREPGNLPAETPQLVSSMVASQMTKHDHDIEQVATLALMLQEPFRRHYLADVPPSTSTHTRKAQP